tara:strand:- start:181 stop:1692 length:1512 start_codon:yes stop_codon:yes gene_type:complete
MFAESDSELSTYAFWSFTTPLVYATLACCVNWSVLCRPATESNVRVQSNDALTSMCILVTYVAISTSCALCVYWFVVFWNEFKGSGQVNEQAFLQHIFGFMNARDAFMADMMRRGQSALIPWCETQFTYALYNMSMQRQGASVLAILVYLLVIGSPVTAMMWMIYSPVTPDKVEDTEKSFTSRHEEWRLLETLFCLPNHIRETLRQYVQYLSTALALVVLAGLVYVTLELFEEFASLMSMNVFFGTFDRLRAISQAALCTVTTPSPLTDMIIRYNNVSDTLQLGNVNQQQTFLAFSDNVTMYEGVKHINSSQTAGCCPLFASITDTDAAYTKFEAVQAAFSLVLNSYRALTQSDMTIVISTGENVWPLAVYLQVVVLLYAGNLQRQVAANEYAAENEEFKNEKLAAEYMHGYNMCLMIYSATMLSILLINVYIPYHYGINFDGNLVLIIILVLWIPDLFLQAMLVLYYDECKYGAKFYPPYSAQSDASVHVALKAGNDARFSM